MSYLKLLNRFILSGFSVVFALNVSSCSSPRPSDVQCLEKVSYITKYPYTKKLKAEVVDIKEAIGALDVFIFDNYLLVSTMSSTGCVHVYDRETLQFHGCFLNKGDAINEILFSPFFNHMSRFGDELILFNGKKNLIAWNVSESVAQGTTVSRVWDSTTYEPMHTFVNFVAIDKQCFLCKEVNKDITGQDRFILKDGERIILPAQERLNRVTTSTPRDSWKQNLVGGVEAYSPENHLIVEGSTHLNSIHIYDLDDKFSKTICIGKRLDRISKIEHLSDASMPTTCLAANAYRDCFAVLYFGATALDEELLHVTKPQILVFDWDGNPKACYKLPVNISAFDIDWKSSVIYGIDYSDNTFYSLSFK